MKTQVLTRIYALAMSAVFATVATVGVAILMTSSGEHSRTQFDAAQQTSTLILVHDQVAGKSSAL